MSAIDLLIKYIYDLKFENLSDHVIDYLKVHLLDTLGAIIAGSSAECTKKLLRIVTKWGGAEEGTIFVYGLKVPLQNAAWINSTMARGYDFESLLGKGATHVPACIIPAAFAIAEYSIISRNHIIDGKEFLTGLALGLDLNFRLRVAGGEKTIMGGGWLAETFSPIAIAAMGAKMLNFERNKLHYALNIAYSQCCGTYGATIGDGGGLMAQVSQGLGTMRGILSLILADEGFTASRNDIIEGEWSLYKMYGSGTFNREALLGNLGKSFDHIKPIIKRYPGCGGLQSAIHTALNLLKEHNIKPHEITRVKLYVNKLNYLQLVHGRGKPLNTPDILWNERFMVAISLAKNRLSIGDLNEGCLKDPQILEIYDKTEVEVDENLEVGEVKIEIETREGTIYSRKSAEVPAMSMDEIINKFRTCCVYAAKPFPKEKIDAIVDTILRIERQTNVTTIISCLCV